MLSELFAEKSMSVRRLKTSWLEAGERGQPVLFFCHGFPDGPDIWRHQIEALAKDYRIVAPYVRGCESSEPAEELGRYGRDAVVLDHLAILAETTNGNEPVICIGHDLGVVHAFTFGRKIGDRLAGLVVINGLDIEMFVRRLRDPAQVARSWYMGFMQMPWLPEACAKWAPNTASWLAQSLAGGVPETVSISQFEHRTVAPLNQYRAFARESFSANTVPARIKAPVLVIWGRDDGVLMAPTQAEWDRVALDSTIRIIPGGHWLHRDHHSEVTSFIKNFVKNLIGDKQDV